MADSPPHHTPAIIRMDYINADLYMMYPGSKARIVATKCGIVTYKDPLDGTGTIITLTNPSSGTTENIDADDVLTIHSNPCTVRLSVDLNGAVQIQTNTTGYEVDFANGSVGFVTVNDKGDAIVKGLVSNMLLDISHASAKFNVQDETLDAKRVTVSGFAQKLLLSSTATPGWLSIVNTEVLQPVPAMQIQVQNGASNYTIVPSQGSALLHMGGDNVMFKDALGATMLINNHQDVTVNTATGSKFECYADCNAVDIVYSIAGNNEMYTDLIDCTCLKIMAI